MAPPKSCPVVAEGVETNEELPFLAQAPCNIAQGYLLGRPGPIERFAVHTHGPEREPEAVAA
ncbi:EAL domain-containing protein [Methylobacterium sp. NEAU K]|uniref:EAL domain-containing protein n=1 Tax=Methylobacterium sp. NEAU K TaxID=3064946 RepID=UPI00351E23B4